ncbi:MAG: DUF438 domain-containing protein, partial [Bacteroidota bacterium]
YFSAVNFFIIDGRKMSEVINNSKIRVEILKKLLLDLHNGISVEETKSKLSDMLGSVPYGEVVQAEQELIHGGLPAEEIMKYCDLHSDAMKGKLDLTLTPAPDGHPVHTFMEENKSIMQELDKLKHTYHYLQNISPSEDAGKTLLEVRKIFNALTDIEKHYVRKENLVFPFLEKYEITGPPTVMWGKDDEVRTFIKSSLKLFETTNTATVEELLAFFDLMFNPTIKAVEEMIFKEEKILFPMCLDTFTEIDWYEIYRQSNAIGYCLFDPTVEWKPKIEIPKEEKNVDNGRVQLSTGSFTKEELEALFGALPVDITFVDKDDKVRYFSHGKERIFERSRAILGRQVQFCHPPSSVHVVEKILNDFKSGKQNEATFWINFHGKFVHIAYYAMHDAQGKYLGTLEVTQDVSQYKKLEGERRLLTYDN